MRLRRRQPKTDGTGDEVASSDDDGVDFASVLDRELSHPTSAPDPTSEPDGSESDGTDDSDGSEPEDQGRAPEVTGVDETRTDDEPSTHGPVRHPTVVDFWASYDEARAAADLFAVPPAAVIAVVGPLESVAGVVDRVRRRHWDGDSKVVLLTDRADGASNLDQADPTPWTIVRRPDDLVATLDHDPGDAPVLVVDVPGELPSWMHGLISSLRGAGLGLVHYVLDGHPTDEDLATWHGQLGRPSVLDLAAPIEPARVVELLDRGEPIASIGGIELSAELLLALKTELQPIL